MRGRPYSIGIIGNGFVGKATRLLMDEKIGKTLVYDIDPKKCEPHGTTVKTLVQKCDVIFVCVPTPLNSETKKCETSIVESCISEIRLSCQYIGMNVEYPIVIRSTVPVGFCKKFSVYHMPEFLTEANWEKDFYNNKTWIFGLTGDKKRDMYFCKIITDICKYAKMFGNIGSDNIRFVDTDTSEFVKYGRNCFLAAKLSICNEYYEFCQSCGINYDTAIELIGNDDRIGNKYTSVPGPDGKRGWSGTCFPKDTSAFVDQLHDNNCSSFMIQAAIERNNTIDRKDKDWNKPSNKGRTYT
jgi:nucleotide sugar dehydrogenase